MSKVEIDVSEVPLDEQIGLAIEIWQAGKPCGLRQLFTDFAAGKFSARPLPEILKPAWASEVWVDGRAGTLFNVSARADGVKFGGSLQGQCRRSAKEAIEAWNEGMRL